MSSELQTVAGTPYPATGSVPNGVYIPYYSGTGCASAACYGSYNAGTGVAGHAGGFYIQGNASITLTASTAGNGSNVHPTQTYTIVQGSTTTTIVVDNTLSTTTVTSGSSIQTLTGVPAQLDPNSGAVINQTDPSGSGCEPHAHLRERRDHGSDRDL